LDQIPADELEVRKSLLFSIVDKMLAEVERNPDAKVLLGYYEWRGFQIEYYMERHFFADWAVKVRNGLPGLTAPEIRFLNEHIAMDPSVGLQDLLDGGAQDSDLKNMILLSEATSSEEGAMDILRSFSEAPFSIKRKALQTIKDMGSLELWHHVGKPAYPSANDLVWIRNNIPVLFGFPFFILRKRLDFPVDALIEAADYLLADGSYQPFLEELIQDASVAKALRLHLKERIHLAEGLFSFIGSQDLVDMAYIPLERRCMYLRDAVRKTNWQAELVKHLDEDSTGFWADAMEIVGLELRGDFREVAIQAGLADCLTAAKLRTRVALTSEQQSRAEEVCMTYPACLNVILDHCKDLSPEKSVEYIEYFLRGKHSAAYLADKVHLLTPEQKNRLYKILVGSPKTALLVCKHSQFWDRPEIAAAASKVLECPASSVDLRIHCNSLPEHVLLSAEQKALEDADSAGVLREKAAFLSPSVRRSAELKALESHMGCTYLLLCKDLPTSFKHYIHQKMDMEKPGWMGDFCYD
jgi:hypothetical protein